MVRFGGLMAVTVGVGGVAGLVATPAYGHGVTVIRGVLTVREKRLEIALDPSPEALLHAWGDGEERRGGERVSGDVVPDEDAGPAEGAGPDEPAASRAAVGRARQRFTTMLSGALRLHSLDGRRIAPAITVDGALRQAGDEEERLVAGAAGRSSAFRVRCAFDVGGERFLALGLRPTASRSHAWQLALVLGAEGDRSSVSLTSGGNVEIVALGSSGAVRRLGDWDRTAMRIERGASTLAVEVRMPLSIVGSFVPLADGDRLAGDRLDESAWRAMEPGVRAFLPTAFGFVGCGGGDSEGESARDDPAGATPGGAKSGEEADLPGCPGDGNVEWVRVLRAETLADSQVTADVAGMADSGSDEARDGEGVPESPFPIYAPAAVVCARISYTLPLNRRELVIKWAAFNRLLLGVEATVVDGRGRREAALSAYSPEVVTVGPDP